MLNALNDLFLKLCWHNRRIPIQHILCQKLCQHNRHRPRLVVCVCVDVCVCACVGVYCVMYLYCMLCAFMLYVLVCDNLRHGRTALLNT